MLRYQDDRIHDALGRLGVRNAANILWNMPTAALYEEAVRRREGLVAHCGPLVCPDNPTAEYLSR
jgi:hypothetical protein